MKVGSYTDYLVTALYSLKKTATIPLFIYLILRRFTTFQDCTAHNKKTVMEPA
jgi:hypothetical protein